MIGERIRLAREACRLTQEELAAASGLAQGTLSAIEAGRVLNPSAEAVERIAVATAYPTSFFYLGPLPDLPEGRYRRLKKGTSKEGKQVRAQVRQVVEIVQRSEATLKLPPVRLEPRRSSEVTGPASVETIAAETRAALGIGLRDPIPNVTRALERAGVIVVRLPGGMPDHDGFSAWTDFGLGLDSARPIIAITGGHPGDRDRFTVAHELGHLLLHTIRSGIPSDQAEDEANRFAGALLIPAQAARGALRSPVTLRVLMAVKAQFGASIAMTAKRGLDLGLISKDHYVSIRRQLSARRWNKEEPVEVHPEQPMLISNILEQLSGGGSVTERAVRLSMPVFSYRALAGSLHRR
jgi:Zn-dependent peptidase ImmA (M78 family)/DNA-binding XRE family transcriptional regulator